MKLGLKDMKKEYKKVNLDEIEVWPFCFQSSYCLLISTLYIVFLVCLCYIIHLHVMSGIRGKQK